MPRVSALSAWGRSNTTRPSPFTTSKTISGSAIAVPLFLQQVTGDDQAHDLVRALEDLMDADVP